MGGASDDAARARDLYKRGRDEYAKGHLPQAYTLLIEAWGIQKSFDVAGNLALAEGQLTRYREAAEHAVYALANFPVGGSEAQRKGLQAVLVEARPFIGAITFQCSADHAAITVDGRPAGESPVAGEVFVEPGPHTVVATLPGCEPVQDTLRSDKGSTHLLTLTFTRCGTPPPPPKIPLKPVPRGPDPVTIAGVVATGVGLGLGAAFAILTKIKADDAATKATLVGSSGCGTGSTACQNLHDALVSHDTFANGAVWTFVAAGAVGVGTLVYTFAVPHGPAPVSRAMLVPVAGPGSGGLVVKGVF
jgi:hypothetical protein